VGEVIILSAYPAHHPPQYSLFYIDRRYTLFYVLYPIGAGGEAYMLYASLDQIALTWGSGAYYASQAALSIYILGLAMMMGYMHKQRRRHLHPKPKPAPSPKKTK
jgi:hypothetical protein